MSITRKKCPTEYVSSLENKRYENNFIELHLTRIDDHQKCSKNVSGTSANFIPSTVRHCFRYVGIAYRYRISCIHQR